MDQEKWKQAVRPMPRRGFLRLTGLGLGAAAVLQACGGETKDEAKETRQESPGAGGAGQPAKLSGRMTMLLWSHFVPAFDEWFDKMAQDWGKANGVEVRVDHIPHLELPARYAAEIASQSGHDLIQFAGSGGYSAHIYPKHLEDLSDLGNKLDKEKGGYNDFAKAVSNIQGKWMSLPDYWIRFPIIYREDLWSEAGYPKGPDTWDDLLEGGRKLKARGNPGGFGMANHTDSLASCHGLLFCFGGKVWEADGKTVALDSRETREALRFGTALAREAMADDIFAWDDNSNNTLLASGRGSWIHNPISASLSIRNGRNLELYNKLAIANTPQGPAGRRVPCPPVSFGIWKFAKNKDAARAFLNSYMVDKWIEGYKVSESYNEPFLGTYNKEGFAFVPTLKDERLRGITDFSQYAVVHSYPAPMHPADEEQWQSYVIPTMFAKAARGGNPDDAIKEATAAIKKFAEKWSS